MRQPGAVISMVDPQFEKSASVSSWSRQKLLGGARQGSGQTVVVRHRGDREYLRGPGRAVVRRIRVVVPRSDGDGDTGVSHAIHRCVDRRGDAAGQTQVRNLDRRGTGGHPVHPGDDLRCRAGPVVAEDANRPQARTWRDTDDADPVVECPDRPCDVRAVPVPIAPSGAAGREEGRRSSCSLRR